MERGWVAQKSLKTPLRNTKMVPNEVILMITIKETALDNCDGENPGYRNGICTCFLALAIFSFLGKIYIPVFQNRYEDNCGVYWPFEPERNVPVECNSDESHTPGTFCVKVTRQGPRGFICKHFFTDI